VGWLDLSTIIREMADTEATEPQGDHDPKRPLVVRVRLFLVHLVEQLVGLVLRQP
jgi:hypothetical protein